MELDWFFLVNSKINRHHVLLITLLTLNWILNQVEEEERPFGGGDISGGVIGASELQS